MKLVSAFVLSMLASGASALSVQFSLAGTHDHFSSFSGSFSGRDSNRDGTLSLDELTAFSASAFNPSVGFPGLGMSASGADSFSFGITGRVLDFAASQHGSRSCNDGFDPVNFRDIISTEATRISFGTSTFGTRNIRDSRSGMPDCGASPSGFGLNFDRIALNFQLSEVPVPASGLLLTTALGLILLRRRLG